MTRNNVFSRAQYHFAGISHLLLYALRGLFGLLIISGVVMATALACLLCLPLILYRNLCKTFKD